MKPNLIHLFIFFCLSFGCDEDDSANPTNTNSNPPPRNIPATPPDKQGSETSDIKLLFIGNSLTYFNDLPGLVLEVAKTDEVEVNTTMVAKPNYALEDHIADGDIQKMIRDEAYDFVIIQQGPSSQPYGRETLVSFGREIKRMCDQADAQLIFYMVWPSRQYYHTFDGVIANYRNGATSNNALLAPVGEVWKAHFDQTADFSYYGPDQFHPSEKGSQVAAEVIWETIIENN